MIEPRTAVDTSVLIAALLSWHECHVEALGALEAALEREQRIVLPAPTLLETYSVLTRLPAPHRMSPGDAMSLLEDSFRDSAQLVSLDDEEVWPFLGEAAARETAGGALYDAQILACARKAGASHVLTLNRRDFERLSAPGLTVVVPVTPL